MFKKSISTLLALTLTLSLFTGCKTETAPTDTTTKDTTAVTTAPATPAEPVAGEATKMEMWVFVELHGKFYAEMQKKWNAENPDKQVDITFVTYPYDDMHNKLLLAIQAGEGAPDMADIEVGKFPNYMKGEPQLMDLTKYIDKYRKDVVESRLTLYEKDGKEYGVPTHVGATVAFYNTEILEAAGVDYTTIKTIADYRAAGLKVKENTDATMGPAETSAEWFVTALLAQQKSDFSKEDGTPNLDSPEVLRAFTLLKDMQNEGTLKTVAGGQMDTEDGYGLMNTGQIASCMMPLWFMSRFTDYMGDLSGKIAIAPVPVMEEGMPRSLGLGGTGTVVTLTAKNPELAAEWLTWAKLSKEGNVEIWNTLGFDPVNTEVWSDTAITHNPDNKFVKYFKVNPFDVLNEVKDEIMLIRSTYSTPTINTTLNTEVANDIFENNADIAETLKTAQETVLNQVQ